MRPNPILRKFALSLLTALISCSAYASDLSTLASAVDAHYNHLRTLQTDFTEIYSGAGTDRTETGVLLLKKPGKMRWEYRSPREKLFVSDGHDVWFYVPGENQARRSEVKKLDDLRSPLAFLLGKTKLEKELQGLSLALDVKPLNAGNTVLRGVPKGLQGRISQVLLEISPGHAIERIVMEEMDGSTTEYRFANQREDLALADGQFNFRVPAGVEIIEESFGQQ